MTADQWKLIELLIGDKKRITCVGDTDQSIYNFRGSTIVDFAERIKIFEAVNSTIELNQNYRSMKSIVDLATRYHTTHF